ncbi:MAG: hypothetical protein A2V88_12695 [Elusimicrobia bacterium RBG_16_66_12]|nr:MAG: hypothetical protein A2V88_12695 [Elusimicrobia bacterium RBG_16_66_12]
MFLRRCVLFSSITLGLLVVGGMGWMAAAGKRARNASMAMVWQFSPGKPMRRFFARADSLGADQFVIEPDGGVMPAGGMRSLERKLPDFRTRWPAFRDDFESLTSGTAEVRFMGAPPFERYYCRIDFKDGRVVAVKRRVID